MTHARSLALLLAATLVSGCTDLVRYALLGTRDHATTEGEANVEPREDGRFDLEVTLDRLPPLASFGDEATAYVLWVQEDGADAPTNQGTLTMTEGRRTGVARTVIATRGVSLRVTAEASADATSPSDAVIVATVLEPAD